MVGLRRLRDQAQPVKYHPSCLPPGFPPPSNPSGFIAEPVNTALGNYVYQRTDLVLPGRGLSLAFSRTYNSQDSTGGPLGPGWTHSYHITLIENPDDGSVALRWGDGHQDFYSRNADGTYSPRFGGLYDQLVKEADGSFRLTRKDQTVYRFSPQGRLTSITDKNSNAITFSYDSDGKLTTITDTVGRALSLAYDANGNRTRMDDPLGTHTYSYDALNRLTDYTDHRGNAVLYAYDRVGNRTSLTYPDGVVVSYSYDVLNRLSTVTDWLSGVTAYSYDAAGNLLATTLPNGTTADYAYDAAGRLTDLINAKSDATVLSGYTYVLDGVGNRVEATQEEPLPPNPTPGVNIAYTYEADNRMLSAGGTAFVYDANGNMTSQGATTYSYDFEDRLVEVLGGTSTRYLYDGLGNRVAAIKGGVTTNYLLDIAGPLAQVLAEADGAGDISAYYIYGLGLIDRISTDGTSRYYHYDALGSAVALTDATQGITDRYAYGPFGEVTDRDGTTRNPFRYIGKYGVIKEGNGLLFMRARYYEPALGRFLNHDPQGGLPSNPQSPNRYIYALNNPIVLIDPSGLFSWKAVALGTVAAVGAVGITALSGGAALPVVLAAAGGFYGGYSLGETAEDFIERGDKYANLMQAQIENPDASIEGQQKVRRAFLDFLKSGAEVGVEAPGTSLKMPGNLIGRGIGDLLEDSPSRLGQMIKFLLFPSASSL